MTDQYIDVLFDGPPGAIAGRFVECENERGHGVRTGEWIAPEPPDNIWRLRIKVFPGLNGMAARIYEAADSHGFWEGPDEALSLLDMLFDGVERKATSVDAYNDLRNWIQAKGVRNMGEMLMLATSELAEALEEHRDSRPVHYYSCPDCKAVIEPDNGGHISPEGNWCDGKKAKPEGLAVELADCIIRCLDTMRSLNVDINAIVEEKMTYNEGRGHKHGKAY
jgi:NTP pyrophosphatase (non-canonical NTP hydrolase)